MRLPQNSACRDSWRAWDVGCVWKHIFPMRQNAVWRHALAIGGPALIDELMWGGFFEFMCSVHFMGRGIVKKIPQYLA